MASLNNMYNDSLYIHRVSSFQLTVRHLRFAALVLGHPVQGRPYTHTDTRSSVYAHSRPRRYILIRGLHVAVRATWWTDDRTIPQIASLPIPTGRRFITSRRYLRERASERAGERAVRLSTYLPPLLVPLDHRSISEPRARSLVVLWTPAKARRARVMEVEVEEEEKKEFTAGRW